MAGRVNVADVNTCKAESSYEDCVVCVSKTNEKPNPKDICTPTTDGKWSGSFAFEGISQYSLVGMKIGVHRNFGGFYMGPLLSMNITISDRYKYTDPCPGDIDYIVCGSSAEYSSGGAFAGLGLGKYFERANLSYGVHSNVFVGNFDLYSPDKGQLWNKTIMMYQLYADVLIRDAIDTRLGDYGLFGGANVFCEPLTDSCDVSFLLGVKGVGTFSAWNK